MTKLAATVVLCLGLSVCLGQTSFRHLARNHKLHATASAEKAPEESSNIVSHKNAPSPAQALHPARSNPQNASQRRLRRQRSAPQSQQYSSQELYLMIRRGEGMEGQKAQNRKMWSGK